jgi:hypothetical protein
MVQVLAVSLVALLGSETERWPKEATDLSELVMSCEKQPEAFGQWFPRHQLREPLLAAAVENPQLLKRIFAGSRCRAGVALRSYQEPVLPGLATEAYRIIWWPSFATPVVIRVESSRGHYTAVVKRDLRDVNGERVTGEFETVVSDISASDFAEVRAVAERAGCWAIEHTCSAELSVFRDPGKGEVVALADGESWLLEGARTEAHWAVRVSHPHGGPFMEVCAAIVKAAHAEKRLTLFGGTSRSLAITEMVEFRGGALQRVVAEP